MTDSGVRMIDRSSSDAAWTIGHSGELARGQDKFEAPFVDRLIR
jgi:hypothetical protein